MWHLHREGSRSWNKSSHQQEDSPWVQDRSTSLRTVAGRLPSPDPGTLRNSSLGVKGEVTHFLPKNDLELTPFLTAAAEAAPEASGCPDHLEPQPPARQRPGYMTPAAVLAGRAPQPRGPSARSPSAPHAPREKLHLRGCCLGDRMPPPAGGLHAPLRAAQDPGTRSPDTHTPPTRDEGLPPHVAGEKPPLGPGQACPMVPTRRHPACADTRSSWPSL